MSFNKVIIIGNLTRDPELRQTQSGASVCRFAIAVNRSYNAQDGSARDETCFVEIDCFGKSAENISKFFTKGKPILVEGRLRQDSWEDKQSGQKRTKLLVVLERFEFVGGSSQDGAQTPARTDTRRTPQGSIQRDFTNERKTAQTNADWEASDDDVPF